MLHKFAKLRNFQLGKCDYENTCFIACVANLSAWIPSLEDGLLDIIGIPLQGFDNNIWLYLVSRIRERWNGRYQWTLEYRGQADAADLIGDILFDKLPGEFAIDEVSEFEGSICQHKWTSRSMQTSMCLLEVQISKRDNENIFLFVNHDVNQ